MAKVSVLVAAYNAARFLPRSLDSLLCQTHADLQVICVDDASTDATLSVLTGYAARDSRVTVIPLSENVGQARARNVALQQAVGDYVCFLDSDDWLSPDAIAEAVDVFHQHADTDCVLFRLLMVTDGHEESYPMEPFDCLTGYEAFVRSLDWRVHGVYMTRRSLFQRVPYDDTCRSYSDDNTTRIHYYLSRQVRPCRGTYYYLQHATSVTHQQSVRRFDHLRANESMKRQLLSLSVDRSLLARYEQVRWLVLVDCYMFYHVHGRYLTAAERRYGLSELHRVWQSVDRTLLNKETTAKFGYRPCKWWWLFRCQEWCYFTLRGLLGKNL
jgi:glycosyltransferase involved in cell wall biosynthesis